MYQIDLKCGYSIDCYLNNCLDSSTDKKLKRLNSVTIICAHCYTVSNSYMYLGDNCYYCDCLLNNLRERKHQDLFEIVNFPNYIFITSEECFDLIGN